MSDAEITAEQREIFTLEAQLKARQAALDAVIEANGYDGVALMHRVYYPEQ